MSATGKIPPTTIVLSKYFDKNVRLIAGTCSKCYLEDDNEVKIVAVNRKFVKEAEKRKKIKCSAFLHDEYSCEDDRRSHQAYENDHIKLLQTTTFTGDDYTLITFNTSPSRQTKPRLNCYNDNSACENKVTNSCTKIESFIKSNKAHVNKDYDYFDNSEIETRAHFSTENILNNTISESQGCFNITNNSINLNNQIHNIFVNKNNPDVSIPQIFKNTKDNPENTNLYVIEDATLQNNFSGELFQTNIEDDFAFSTIQNDLDPPSQKVAHTNYLTAKDPLNNENHSSGVNHAFADTLKNENTRCNNFTSFNRSSDQNNLPLQSQSNDIGIKNNINCKVNLSKLSQSTNSQRPKWFSLNNDIKIKIEADIKDENSNSAAVDNLEIFSNIKSVKNETEIKRFLNFTNLKIKKNRTIENSIWVPQRSPHNLIEESLYHDPWSLLIATIFLNKTSCMCARPRVEEFLKDFSGPLDVLKEHPAKLEKYFLELGLHKKRAEQVWRMSYDYAYKNWRSPKELYGIGKYGEDAYRMFILGDLDIEPTDRFLRIYRDWARMKQKEDMNAMYQEDNTKS